MKNTLGAFAGLLIMVTGLSCRHAGSNGYNNSKLDSAGYKFVKSSMESGLTDIKASGLAITNSNNLRVINLAKMMIADQTLSDSSLQKIESQNNITGGDTILAAHAADITLLAKKSGSDFDKAYLNTLIEYNRSATDLNTIAGNSADSSIRFFAKQNAPMIKTHLDSARAVISSLK